MLLILDFFQRSFEGVKFIHSIIGVSIWFILNNNKNGFCCKFMNRNFTHMSNLFHNNKESSDNIFDSWSYDKENYVLFGAGIITIILGYIIMATGDTYSFQSLSLAPILLFIGYIILIPIALFYKKKK